PGPEDTAAPLPATVQAPSQASPPSWRNSQSLATFHSRCTVSEETLKTSAVSSTLRPPKKRNSTTWLFLRFTPPSRFKASSRAAKSACASCDGSPAVPSRAGFDRHLQSQDDPHRSAGSDFSATLAVFCWQ